MKIKINNIDLNYTKTGEGYPIILLHGNGEDLHIFDKLSEKLNPHFTVYAIDSRNHGESSRTNDYSYETMAQDIYQFIRELNLQDVSILGFSDGAIIASILAIQNPDIFKKMILLGINLKPSDLKKEVYDFIAEEYEKTKSPLFKLMLEQPNIELEELKKIKTPTLVVAGEDDLCDKEFFENIAQSMPNAKLRIIEGHDHGSYIIDQDIIYPDIIDFL